MPTRYCTCAKLAKVPEIMNLKMKLPAPAAKTVNDAMQSRAALSLEQFLADRMQWDATEAMANVRKHWHPDWPDEWLELKVRLGSASNSLLGWYHRGVARRCTTGDLDEFGLSIQMQVRKHLLVYAGQSSYIDVWELLRALAIRDQEAVRRYIEDASFPLKDGDPDVRAVYNGVQAILRSDKAQLDALQKKKPSAKSPAWLTGTIRCLQGISARDPFHVASGINQHLDGFRRSGAADPLEKIISLEAHGLYRLAEQIDPKLVKEVDITRDLPWDQEFHAWSTNSRPRLAIEHFGPKCPRPLAEAFVHLGRPEWAR